MKATEILMKEHRLIERVVASLERAADLLEAGVDVEGVYFLDAVDFAGGFADGCHHKKEEDVLFKVMSAAGVPVEGGPIGVMLYEHEQGRSYIHSLKAAALKYQAGEATAQQEIIQNARGYASLLRAHIAKEDNILFPMAERVIPPESQLRMLNDFEIVESARVGVCLAYYGVAETLEQKIAGYSQGTGGSV